MSRFSEILMEHFNSPRNSGRLESPDRVGIGGVPGQGPFVILSLRVKEDVVVEAKYQASGCGVTIASGSMITEMVKNKSLEFCRTIGTEQLSEALGGVPSDKAHAPMLAITALRNALQEQSRNPERSEASIPAG